MSLLYFTMIPQVRDSVRKATFGNMNSVAVLKTSRNISTSIAAAFSLTGAQFQWSFTSESGIPSSRRDVLSRQPGTAQEETFFDSALIAKGWLDPAPGQSDIIFQTMIDNVISGRSKIKSAIDRAHVELQNLFPKQELNTPGITVPGVR